jgi:hypothetical protein
MRSWQRDASASQPDSPHRATQIQTARIAARYQRSADFDDLVDSRAFTGLARRQLGFFAFGEPQERSS